MKSFFMVSALLLSLSTHAESLSRTDFIKNQAPLISTIEDRIQVELTGAVQFTDVPSQMYEERRTMACLEIGKYLQTVDFAIQGNIETSRVIQIHKHADGKTTVDSEVIDLDKLSNKLEQMEKELCYLRF
ncbi:MAG TPA: hypothetical protein VI754_02345 [Bacteriovoracaceae bacterium]|nr:hypothetical protein [Bacteriovoracaceae bacterium]